MYDSKELKKKFESEGEAAVQDKLVQGAYNQQKAKIAEDWLREKEEERERLRNIKRDSILKNQAHAMWAMVIVAGISLIISIIALIISLLK